MVLCALLHFPLGSPGGPCRAPGRAEVIGHRALLRACAGACTQADAAEPGVASCEFRAVPGSRRKLRLFKRLNFWDFLGFLEFARLLGFWFRFWFDLILHGFRFDFDFDLAWFWFDFDLISIWFCLDLAWFWFDLAGFRLDSAWFRLD